MGVGALRSSCNTCGSLNPRITIRLLGMTPSSVVFHRSTHLDGSTLSGKSLLNSKDSSKDSILYAPRSSRLAISLFLALSNCFFSEGVRKRYSHPPPLSLFCSITQSFPEKSSNAMQHSSARASSLSPETSRLLCLAASSKAA